MSPSGLNALHQRQARSLVRRACARLLENPAQVHYTQGPGRWDGINQRKGITKPGFWPFYGDCSATATWVLWRALYVPFGVRDVVNGENWTGGFTGTMLHHGVNVDAHVAKAGDLALYGHGWPGEHVAVCLGDGTVMSHGSEGGPYRLPLRYRPDLLEVRRYV
jgi:hypothetical protein